MKSINKWLIVLTLIGFNSCSESGYGLIESNFRLSDASRLPKWFQIPSPYTRKDVSVKITLYSNCPGACSKITLHGPLPEEKILDEKKGLDTNPPESVKTKWHGFPEYFIIEVDGISEIFEQRKSEAIVYISDDPELISEFNLN
jgi:hypothetical protein